VTWTDTAVVSRWRPHWKSGSTINAAAYQETLKRLEEAIRCKRAGLLIKGLGVLLLHDNARPHSAAAPVNLLNSWGWEILPHPPYSPDLASSDFYLFPKMKKHLRAQRCHSNEAVQNEVKKWLRVQDVFFFCEGLNKFIYRYGKCLNRLCDYVEK
jgi:transposase